MSFTRALRSLTKAISVLLVIILCGCGDEAEVTPTATPSAASGVSEEDVTVSYEETDEITNYCLITMADGGEMLMELYPDIAPVTVENFQKLVSEHFYDGLIFHRVIKNFMIQTGDPTGLGSGGSSETIYGEFGANGFSNSLKHTRGVVSMARRGGDNDSASSQFFIVHADYPSLNGQYAAFGKLLSGYDTLDKIANTKTNSSDRPVEEQVISSIRFVNIAE